jgi:hypothetical protein
METRKFNDLELETIINRTVDLVATNGDKEFFRAALYLRADASTSSADFSAFIAKVLKF